MDADRDEVQAWVGLVEVVLGLVLRVEVVGVRRTRLADFSPDLKFF